MSSNPETAFMQARVRLRQETINKRYKHFGALKNVWRHDLHLHGVVFSAISVILQVTINTGEKLFRCGYRDPPYDTAADGHGGDGEGAMETDDGAAEDDGAAADNGAADAAAPDGGVRVDEFGIEYGDL